MIYRMQALLISCLLATSVYAAHETVLCHDNRQDKWFLVTLNNRGKEIKRKEISAREARNLAREKFIRNIVQNVVLKKTQGAAPVVQAAQEVAVTAPVEHNAGGWHAQEQGSEASPIVISSPSVSSSSSWEDLGKLSSSGSMEGFVNVTKEDGQE